MDERHEQIFHQRETEIANKQMKRCLTSLVIKKMHTETTVEHDTHSWTAG